MFRRSALLCMLLKPCVCFVLHTCVLQAMIHELIGIKDNTAALTSPKISEQYRYFLTP